MNEFKKLEREAENHLKNIIQSLNYDRDFYECDIDYEYSPFEESVKDFCDKYINQYLDNNENAKAFKLIVKLTEAIEECDMCEEDIFRPVELITYYIAKIITLPPNSLKNKIHNWMYTFANNHE